MRPKTLAKKAAQLALEKKAEDIVIMDVRKLTSVTDFFVICSAESSVQLKAIVDHIVEELEKKGVKAWHIEGYTNLSWVLIDYVDVVVHAFLKPAREFYGLERFWGDAKFEYITEDSVKPKTKSRKRKKDASISEGIPERKS
ncbi:ribosome-associated protein [Candidatus Kryptobacter tengchongensis]|uniref:Ribosomal silencing factor RsfS n=1 Tax=Kryptobacter tengchongensis TaxID=1643429 RepID=A0A916LIX2_KRYT1|nr:ribosome silencing factor [Candidatus Kryptobacter tengchongensis]CUS99300.1 ribosome-associated protein [Candidatus Kryptobacter tengchongensis]CUU10489.1 ribosome-associated protein [Candidatus Kryptobacter tengchongensis]